jgi:hypothetical protein
LTSTVTTPTETAAPSTGRTGLPAVLARRWPTGVAFVATAASLTLLSPLPEQVQVWTSAWCVLLAAVIYLTWGTARGELAAGRWLTVQTTGVLAFGAIAITAAAVDPDAARYVLAAGWTAHAAWDALHHRLGRVVPRWYAETCLVADLCLATVLLTVGLV